MATSLAFWRHRVICVAHVKMDSPEDYAEIVSIAAGGENIEDTLKGPID
jgi:hypothetical protein